MSHKGDYIGMAIFFCVIIFMIWGFTHIIMDSDKNQRQRELQCSQLKCQNENLTPKILHHDGCLCVEIPK